MLRKLFYLLLCIFFAGGAFLFSIVHAGAVEQLIKIIVDNRQVKSDVSPFLSDGRVFVPIRVIAEELNTQVNWDKKNKAVVISRIGTEENEGDSYLKGKNFGDEAKGIGSNMISASVLKTLLDDDGDNDIADYRDGHSGGDQIENDPLVVDIRSKADYDAAHIPGAVWIEVNANMAEKENVQKLTGLLAEHTGLGGKEEIVLYCYTGNTSGLVAGVLGSQGLPVKNLRYGFDIAWQGTKYADRAIKAPMEDNEGQQIECKT